MGLISIITYTQKTKLKMRSKTKVKRNTVKRNGERYSKKKEL